MVQLAPQEHKVAGEEAQFAVNERPGDWFAARHQTQAYLPQVEHVAPGQLLRQEGPAESQQHLVLFFALQAADDVHRVFAVQLSRLQRRHGKEKTRRQHFCYAR